jgi:hypothetical protein
LGIKKEGDKMVLFLIFLFLLLVLIDNLIDVHRLKKEVKTHLERIEELEAKTRVIHGELNEYKEQTSGLLHTLQNHLIEHKQEES